MIYMRRGEWRDETKRVPFHFVAARLIPWLTTNAKKI
jgi:hypothetical protein